MDLNLFRASSVDDTTIGELRGEEGFICFTLEDKVRELAGVPVSAWKIPRETAIPAGRYEVVFEDSQRFGPHTLTVKDVPGFTSIRIHGGNDKDDTKGCILVGNVVKGSHISGAKAAGVLGLLKGKVQAAIDRQDNVWLNVRNPES